jgi:hypothetical protein
MLEPRPGRVAPRGPFSGVTSVDPGSGIVTALAAVTGIKDDDGDLIVPGSFARTLRERPAPRL